VPLGGEKSRNLQGKRYKQYVSRSQFFEWLRSNHWDVRHVFHLGARTDTTERSWEVLLDLNLHFSTTLWYECNKFGLPLTYASSAAVYGAGGHGFCDEDRLLPELRPLNPYAESKLRFDRHAAHSNLAPPRWHGLRFFNVYGGNEGHKGRMSSPIHRWHEMFRAGGCDKIPLFKSRNPLYPDGEQRRDFVYVEDVLDVLLWTMRSRPPSGIYNVGTGEARTFVEAARIVERATDGAVREIEFVEMPGPVAGQYQYRTCADLRRLRAAGYDRPFRSLEEGCADLIRGNSLRRR